ncbi:MAG: hypothetical protein K6F28_10375 [Lachnospiraceae bacterium]|nr:hypothetical protein [Lachnospiraceae bacterium]
MNNNNTIAINNTKPYERVMKKLFENNLVGEPHSIVAFDNELGDRSVPIFLSTNTTYETDYYIDSVDKMLIQRIAGLAIKKGVRFSAEGVFIPMTFSMKELLSEVTKRDVTSNNYLSSVEEILQRLVNLRGISIYIDNECKFVDNTGKIKCTYKEESCSALLNTSFKKITKRHEYTKKEYVNVIIILNEFPIIWAINAQCDNEIFYFDKDLFDFKSICTKKTDDLKKIPARESLLYQALKECVVKEIHNRKYYLQSHRLIKKGKKGTYKISLEKVGQSRWEKDRRINFISILCKMGICDRNGELIGKYEKNSKTSLYKSLKKDITGILAALKEKGYIDSYTEYKTRNACTLSFSGWIIDPSVKYDEKYRNKSIVNI